MTSSGPRCVLGITGNIASGKSSVVSVLVELGATHIDADVVYRELIDVGKPLLAKLAEHFGPGILAYDGRLDRSKLGAIVFSNSSQLRKLDELTHPAVIAEIDARVAAASPEQIIAIDAVKLIESGHAEHCDQVWVVTVDVEQQVARLMKRNTLSEVEARRRIASQAPMEPRLVRADRVIDNSGTPEETRSRVIGSWSDFKASPACNSSKGEQQHGSTSKS